MTHRESYLEGTPSWVDLSTTDVAGSKEFYSSLFGWEWEANDTDEPGNQYHMARIGGRAAAGLMQQPQEQVDMGLPPLWTVYLSVDDCDATAAKVEAAGGSVMAQPFDVMDAGRMAVVVDPTGAVVALWQPKEHIGAEVVNEPGAFTWAELLTPDQGAATEFFGKLVGWDSGAAEMPGLSQPITGTISRRDDMLSMDIITGMEWDFGDDGLDEPATFFLELLRSR